MRMTREVRDAIVSHAREGLPREVVGLLWGTDDCVRAWVPLTNVAEGNASFRLSAAEFEERLAAAPHPLLAIVHSHPREPAVPSTADLAGAAAWRSTVHLILSLADGTARFRAWRLFDGQAMPEPLHILEEEPGAAPALKGTSTWT